MMKSDLSRLAGVFACALAGWPVIGGHALADDYTVNTATTSTVTLDGDDTLTITSGGNITPPSGDVGVEATGGNNRIDNFGLVHTEGGFDAFAIHNNYSDGSPITNSGTILTDGDFANGIFNDNANGSDVTNSGSIHVMGYDSFGIYNVSSSDLSVNNSGSIILDGDSGAGMANFLSSNAPLTNIGSIHTKGYGSYGISNYSSNNLAVTNSGSIYTEGISAPGISNFVSHDVLITNSGSIHTAGISADGISNVGTVRSPVTNSGYVVSELGNAFFFSNKSDATLNLLAPSYIGGAFTFHSATAVSVATTVNITTGPSHSVFWTLDDNMTGGDPVSISGAVPWFYDSTTKQFATYDPTVFGGSVNALGDMTHVLSEVGRADGDGLWATAFGGTFRHSGDSMTLERTVGQFGAAVGYRARPIAGFQWNVMGGYFASLLDASSRWTKSYDVDGTGWFAGVNALQAFGGLIVDLGVTGGRLGYDQSRFVNDNLAQTNGKTLGINWATSSYDGWFVAPEIGISATAGAISGWTLMPSARVRYAGQWLDGYGESSSNSDAEATVGARALGLVEASAELAMKRAMDFGAITLRFGYLNRRSVGASAVPVTMLGTTNAVSFGNTNTSAIYAGAGFDFALAANSKLTLNATGFFGDDFTGGQGMVRASTVF